MKYISLIVIFCCAAIGVAGQELKGTVKTVDGKPVEKAVVRPGYIETDKDGKFKLKNAYESFLVVTASEFRPLVKKLNGESEVEIILEKENREEKLRIPECSQKMKGKNPGVYLKLVVPKGFKSKRGRDHDYTDFYIFSDINSENVLKGIWGPNASSGYPKSDWIKSSNQITSRSIFNGKQDIGSDFSGKTSDGKSWRYVRVFDESIYYIVDSIEKKIIFDKMIDESCSTIEGYFKN